MTQIGLYGQINQKPDNRDLWVPSSIGRAYLALLRDISKRLPDVGSTRCTESLRTNVFI